MTCNSEADCKIQIEHKHCDKVDEDQISVIQQENASEIQTEMFYGGE